MPLAKHCNVIANQIAQQMEKQNREGNEFNDNIRAGQTSDQGYWKTRDGWFVNDLGGHTPPLDSRERISLQGKVNSYQKPGVELTTKGQLFQDLTDIRHRSDMEGLERFTKGLNKEEWANAISVIEGRPLEVNQYGVYKYELGELPQRPMNEKVDRAVGIVRDYFTQRRDVAQKELGEGFGLKAGHFYFPIMHETRTLDQEKFAKGAIKGIAEKLISKRSPRPGQSQGEFETEMLGLAESVYEEYVKGQRARIAGNIERNREFDVGEGRILDGNRVLDLYSKQFWHVVNTKRIFGEKPDVGSFPSSVNLLLGEIQKLYPGNHVANSYAMAYVKDLFGLHPSDPTMHGAVMRTLGALQTLKLSMSVIKNSSQTANTWMRTNLPAVLKAQWALMSNREIFPQVNGREFAGMMGSVLDEAVKQATLFSGEGVVGRAGELVLKATGFSKMEYYNRAWAGLTGAMYAKQQAWGLMNRGKNGSYAKRLAELGIDPERVRANNGNLELPDLLLAGQRIINATQFRTRLTDLPFFASSAPDVYRGLLQFRTFAVNHTRMMVDQMYRRPVRTSLFGLAVMPGVGYGVNWVGDHLRQSIPGYEVPKYQKMQDGMANYLESAASAGSWGLLSDVAYSAYMAGGSGGETFKNFAVPPVFSSIDDYIQMGGYMGRGNLRGLAYTTGRQFGGLGGAFVRSSDWIKGLPRKWDDW